MDGGLMFERSPDRPTIDSDQIGVATTAHKSANAPRDHAHSARRDTRPRRPSQ